MSHIVALFFKSIFCFIFLCGEAAFFLSGFIYLE